MRGLPQTLKLLPNKTELAISGMLFPKDTPGKSTQSFTGTSRSITADTTAIFTVQEVDCGSCICPCGQPAPG
jgi:hypothetical protein